ncbi:MAG: hypothetical protein JSS79_11270 [Bacteroidetes bacterium]|nr:hypothetical protein [Bacteroidota bacterium]
MDIKYQRGVILLLIYLAFSSSSIAQVGKHVLEVAQEERNFAALSKSSNTRDAFVHYFSDEALIFSEGKIINGYESWKKRTADGSELFWFPVVAGSANAGDVAFTSGPWFYKENRDEKAYSDFGYYNSIWKKKDGTWKVILDIGISVPGEPTERDSTIYFAAGPRKVGQGIMKETIEVTERNFISMLDHDKTSAYQHFGGTRMRLYRPGIYPVVGIGGVIKYLEKSSNVASYRTAETWIGESGDLAYTYGFVTNLAPGSAREANFLRIWMLDEKGDWKLVIDVIGGR